MYGICGNLMAHGLGQGHIGSLRTNVRIATLVTISLLLTSCASTSPKPSDSPLPPNDTPPPSLPWPGTYTGILPCADCEGIETTLTLRADQTFSITTKYLGEQETTETTDGTFTWGEDGGRILLRGYSPSHYLVGEKTLIQLDSDGQRILGTHAAEYLLRQLAATPEPLLAAVHWNLVELRGQPITPGPGKTPPTLMFSREEHRVSGVAGCNRYFGTSRFQEGKRLKFSNIGATKMACDDMEVETEFFKVLERTDSYNYDDQLKVLTLTRGFTATLAKFEGVYAK